MGAFLAMAGTKLDIIIPIKNRSTVLRCISTLLSEIARCEEICLGQVLLCDGGSQSTDCQAQMQQLSQLAQVKILACPHLGFNKGWLINQGLAAATAPLVLVSDVDILWNKAALSRLGIAAASHPRCLYSVKSVQESEASAVAPQRPRYAYCLEQTPAGSAVRIYLAPPSLTRDRPGCGLLCGQKKLFQQVGGYRHCFQGWGWEDQDLLIRVQLLGVEIAELGTVVHLSHGDDQRNLENKQPPVQSRDRNILRSLKRISQGRLLGDLSQFDPAALTQSRQPSRRAINVDYPPTLAHATHPNYALSKSSESSH